VRELGVSVVRGVLQIARADFEAVFGDAATVVLLRDAADLLVVPVHQAAAGGCLVKRRNAAGDRAIDAIDLLRDEPGHDAARAVRAVWDDARAALRLPGLFAA
jgi:hypothetical protein